MYRWSKIQEEHPSEIISEINDYSFFKLIVWGGGLGRKLDKNKLEVRDAHARMTHFASPYEFSDGDDVLDPIDAWEGEYRNKTGVFKKFIDNDIPCIKLLKVKNDWSSEGEIDTVVLFLTGECNDIFLIHPDDLIEVS